MAKAITIRPPGRNGVNTEVLQVLTRIGRDECGSALNAALVCIRESPRYRAAVQRMAEDEAAAPKRRKTAS